MSKIDLSILIPARNEIFLTRTVEDIFKNIRGNTEVIVVLDGKQENPNLPLNPKLQVIYNYESIGQRAATNQAAKISKAKYLMKLDAHCSFDEGFDVKMMNLMKDNYTMVPIMRNLHAFDWVCKKCGDRRYQGPTPINCPNCDNTTEFERDIKWIGKSNPQSTSYCFDSEPHFQYFNEYKNRIKKENLTETMSLQGSCFMVTREKYFELNICDEEFGSWGSQGIEVAVKTWLLGGRVVVNHTTWYAHMFRTQGGDFGFPYSLSGRQVDKAKKMARDIFFKNKLPKQKHTIYWLVSKFWPVPGWTLEQLEELKNQKDEKQRIELVEKKNIQNKNVSKGIVYYTDNRIDMKLMTQVQNYLNKNSNGIEICSVSLYPLKFGTKNIVLNFERGYLTMFKQILEGIKQLNVDVIFLAEHDVLYTKEHFEFIPPTKDMFYYNKNNWQVRQTDGHAVYWDAKKVSQLCAYREIMLEHYTERVRRVELEGFSRRMGFEPGTHNRAERVDNRTSEFFKTNIPNLDIRHRHNLTQSRWSPTQFRNPCKNWKESNINSLNGWENFKLV